AEERLREERDFSTQVLETADALILAVDPEGRIVRFNGKCAQVTGYQEEEVRGRVFWTFLVPETYRERVGLAFSKVDASSSDFKRLGVDLERGILAPEMPWCSRSGTERLIAWRYTTVRDRQGRLRYVIAAGIDITEQRQLEEQLRHS